MLSILARYNKYTLQPNGDKTTGDNSAVIISTDKVNIQKWDPGVYVCVSECVCVYIYVLLCMCVCMCVYVCVYCACVCMCVCICVSVCSYTEKD